VRMARRIRLLVSALLLLLGTATAPAADYYVRAQSPQANDAGPGTRNQPFSSLGRACSAATPGDTVYLGAGTYRETLVPANSGEAGKPIRFVSLPGEGVTLSGADPLTGVWNPHQGSIFKLATGLKFSQLFLDGRMLLEARWPNSSATDLMAPRRAVAAEGTGYGVLADPNLPPGDWNGAVVLLWPGERWFSATRRVVDYRPGASLRFDHEVRTERPDPYHAADPFLPRAGNPYVLSGSLAGLDSPGEWFLDEAAGIVYLWTPEGDSPLGHLIEVKQRDYACDLSNRGFVQVQGMDVFAAAVNLTDAHDCLIEDCRLRYVEHLRECNLYSVPAERNVMTGRDNEWRRCLIAYAATTALRVGGVNNRLTNCVIHDANYLGTGRGGLDLSRSEGARVQHCTIFRTGRDAVQHSGSQRICLEYNEVYAANRLNSDAGGIYCWGPESRDGTIAHNWVHDNLGEMTCGIYLDNFSRGFTVHHNGVWACSSTGIRLNSDACDHLVCNNTVAQVAEPFGTYTYAGHTPTMKGTRIINNLVNAPWRPKDPTVFVQGELGPELAHNACAAVDPWGVPTPGSAAVDGGVAIPGITDGFRGNAPDLGAYESGGTRWVAGADWADPEAPQSPAMQLEFAPHAPVTAETMIRDGLLLWLDASDGASLDLAPDGTVRAWYDRSAARLVARPAEAERAVSWVADGCRGRPVVRGNGTGSLRIDNPGGGPGGVTALVVSQSVEPAGPGWQRIIASFTGSGQEWVLPNWIVLRPGGEKPEAYGARTFTVWQTAGARPGRLTILGSSANTGECLAGDVAEVLLFGRALRFDELEALQRYLCAKWDLDN
jgi:hypothetical protein